MNKIYAQTHQKFNYDIYSYFEITPSNLHYSYTITYFYHNLGFIKLINNITILKVTK
jgi:hypothetical protein